MNAQAKEKSSAHTHVEGIVILPRNVQSSRL